MLEAQVPMVASDTEQPAAPQPASRRLVRAAAFIGRHSAFLVVLVAAVGLRAAMLVAYPFPFFFPDSGSYVDRSMRLAELDQYRPIGYPVFLDPFVPGPLERIALVQHLIGVGLVVAAYVFLVRRGVKPWLAALAVVPVAADGLQLMLEHYVAAETVFTTLLAGALFLLAWRPRVPVWAAVAAGLLLAAAVVTRTVGQPLVLLAFVFLVVKLVAKRASWRVPVAYMVAAAVPLAGYMVWYHSQYGVYAFEQVGGRALYSRAMSVADCERLDLTDRQRLLCVPQPPSARPEAADYWGWNADSPGNKYFGSVDEDPFLREFGMTVIRQQSGDYLRVVAKETSWHFRPSTPLSAETLCRFGGWQPPERPNTPCAARYYTSHDELVFDPQPSTPLRAALARYGNAAVAARGPVLAFALLVLLVAVAWRPRRGWWRHSLDALLIGGTGFTLILASVAFGMYEPRYAVTAAFLIPLGAAIALRRHMRALVRRQAE